MAFPRLMMFSRFPQAGKAKTRLIPAVGAARAAALHCRLTEQTLAVLRASPFPVEVRTTGAPGAAFEAWLGEDVAYADQGGGDLGVRLARAAARPPVIVVGSDAPDLRLGHILAAAEALGRAPAVIGPAEDGGYYLLGLREPMPFLFEQVAWGTDTVLETTLSRLKERGITPELLEPLADLDRPEDLARWPGLLA